MEHVVCAIRSMSVVRFSQSSNTLILWKRSGPVTDEYNNIHMGLDVFLLAHQERLALPN